LDAGVLLADLCAAIENPAVRHKGAAPIGYLAGRTGPNRVTCSGLIGQAVLRQPESPYGQALRESLRRRWTYGEITPADLARAAHLVHAAAPSPIEQVFA
jgi:hypothetical protein